MKTPEEIKKWLAPCNEKSGCHSCYFERVCKEKEEVLAYIQQLEANYQQVSKALCGKENATLDEVLQAIAQVKAELEVVKRERDAAVEDAAMGECCETCLYGDTHVLENPCSCCYEYRNWKWQGVCLENTEVQEDG